MFDRFKPKPTQKPVSDSRKYLTELRKERLEKNIEQKQAKGIPTKAEEIYKGKLEQKIEQQKKINASWDQWNKPQNQNPGQKK
ncbi:hypothetical protein HZB05_02950 [Candidatus Wolfebacteria bacterium]|nr:hypothetical protein [Candidatus Wolfebacteria bacterium]